MKIFMPWDWEFNSIVGICKSRGLIKSSHTTQISSTFLTGLQLSRCKKPYRITSYWPPFGSHELPFANFLAMTSASCLRQLYRVENSLHTLSCSTLEIPLFFCFISSKLNKIHRKNNLHWIPRENTVCIFFLIHMFSDYCRRYFGDTHEAKHILHLLNSPFHVNQRLLPLKWLVNPI